MFEQQYQQDVTSSMPSVFNQSIPYTLVYEAQRDMSLAQGIDIGYSTQQILIEQPTREYEEQKQFSSKQNNNLINEQEQSQCYHSQYFYARSQQQIRQSYLAKLINQGIISEEPRRKYRHLFVFDWDDTLLCTTYLNHFNFTELKEKDIKMLQTVDDYSCKILNQCLKKGDISIITNAAKGWVQYSSQKFLPKTFQLIIGSKIPIISARSQYGQEFPNQIKKWKVSAFQKLNSIQTNHLITNIICIGDSTIQMQAGQILASSFQKSLLKTVKFRQNPRIQELIKQQELLLKKLDQIVNTAKNLTIRLERKTSK